MRNKRLEYKETADGVPEGVWGGQEANPVLAGSPGGTASAEANGSGEGKSGQVAGKRKQGGAEDRKTAKCLGRATGRGEGVESSEMKGELERDAPS